MITIADCSILLGPVVAQQRSACVVLSIHNTSEVHYTETRLTLRLQGSQGYMLSEVTLDGPPVVPGTQVISFQAALPPVVLAAVEGDLRCRHGRWSAPVTGITPFRDPETALVVTATPRTPKAAPVGMTPLAPPWERFAVKRSLSTRPIQPLQDPDGPWARLDTGAIEEAMAGFDRHRLNEVGQRRLADMMASTDPVILAQGCRISRLVRWVTRLGAWPV